MTTRSPSCGRRACRRPCSRAAAIRSSPWRRIRPRCCTIRTSGSTTWRATASIAAAPPAICALWRSSTTPARSITDFTGAFAYTTDLDGDGKARARRSWACRHDCPITFADRYAVRRRRGSRHRGQHHPDPGRWPGGCWPTRQRAHPQRRSPPSIGGLGHRRRASAESPAHQQRHRVLVHGPRGPQHVQLLLRRDVVRRELIAFGSVVARIGAHHQAGHAPGQLQPGSPGRVAARSNSWVPMVRCSQGPIPPSMRRRASSPVRLHRLTAWCWGSRTSCPSCWARAAR